MRDGEIYSSTLRSKWELTNRLYLWEQPKPENEAYYLVFLDVGDGIVGGDFSVCEERFAQDTADSPDVQVGEWVGCRRLLSRRSFHALGFYFNRCEIAVEYAREGMTTANALMNDFEYPNIYRPRNDDRLKGQFAASICTGRPRARRSLGCFCEDGTKRY